ncbi:SLOG domain-containing protein [Hymenobacter sublimis]|uniref:Uncharacterized protein n=1 Tax=Hymenobacter sublimis TaxID=2933777 RepID=A0ABY4JBL3_9BACT|nr:hypothetical protein [Hymenobacter sublimis]UPL50213.1 hypothetical protein MWH26_04720 [Hymenobacter sublimis]
MKKIFLSASVPDPQRDQRYHGTADVIAIREAVRALATLILPSAMLVWGGHPAITPLIRIIAEGLGLHTQSPVILYQSAFFEGSFPESNSAFETIIVTKRAQDKKESLALMRQQMLTDHIFDAGVFIGGMEGVEEEFELFKRYQPNVSVLPLATTGGAAKVIYDQQPGAFPAILGSQYSYLSLFRSHIPFLRGV